MLTQQSYSFISPKLELKIPAGTFIQGLNSEILKGNHWKDGETFRPERFLGKHGKTIKEERFIPFSMGRRKCPGETLAKTEMFLFFTNLLHHYCFLPEAEGEIPSADFSPGLTILPLPFQSRIVCRFQFLNCSLTAQSSPRSSFNALFYK